MVENLGTGFIPRTALQIVTRQLVNILASAFARDFFTQYRNFGWCFNSQFYAIIFNPKHDKHNIVSNEDPLI